MKAKPLLARCRPLAQPVLSAYQAGELEQLLNPAQAHVALSFSPGLESERPECELVVSHY